MQKKLDWPKISPVVKNLQFLSNQADIQAILPIHELVILAKFHKDWQKIVDFLVVVKFCASPVFLHQSLEACLCHFNYFLYKKINRIHYPFKWVVGCFFMSITWYTRWLIESNFLNQLTSFKILNWNSIARADFLSKFHSWISEYVFLKQLKINKIVLLCKYNSSWVYLFVRKVNFFLSIV